MKNKTVRVLLIAADLLLGLAAAVFIVISMVVENSPAWVLHLGQLCGIFGIFLGILLLRTK